MIKLLSNFVSSSKLGYDRDGGGSCWGGNHYASSKGAVDDNKRGAPPAAAGSFNNECFDNNNNSPKKQKSHHTYYQEDLTPEQREYPDKVASQLQDGECIEMIARSAFILQHLKRKKCHEERVRI